MAVVRETRVAEVVRELAVVALAKIVDRDVAVLPGRTLRRAQRQKRTASAP
jgi:hypothetical protein